MGPTETPAPGRDGGELYRSIAKMLGVQGSRILVQGVYFLLLARTIGAADFGRFTAVVAVAAMLAPFSCAGLNLAMVRVVARDPDSIRAQWYQAAGAVLFGGLATTAVLALVGAAIF